MTGSATHLRILKTNLNLKETEAASAPDRASFGSLAHDEDRSLSMRLALETICYTPDICCYRSFSTYLLLTPLGLAGALRMMLASTWTFTFTNWPGGPRQLDSLLVSGIPIDEVGLRWTWATGEAGYVRQH